MEGKAISLYRILLVTVLLCAIGSVFGCAKSSVPAEQFIGKWLMVGEDGETVLTGPERYVELRGDGRGTTRLGWDPHPESINWFLKGDKLVLSPRSGGTPEFYEYRFEGTDKMTLAIEDLEITFKRSEDSETDAVGEEDDATTGA